MNPLRTIPSEEACLHKVMELRHGGSELVCSACGKPERFVPNAKLRAFACPDCGFALYPCVGTPFDRRQVPLRHLFHAVRLAAAGSLSAKALERDLSCSREAAQRLEREIQDARAGAHLLSERGQLPTTRVRLHLYPSPTGCTARGLRISDRERIAPARVSPAGAEPLRPCPPG